jgi:hypothetical protein
MNIARNPENVAAGLSVPERTLLFSIACGVDWNYNSSITRAAVAATVLKGLVERDAIARHFSVFIVALVWACSTHWRLFTIRGRPDI